MAVRTSIRTSAWTEEAAEQHYAEGHLKRDAAALDELLGSWRQDLELGQLRDEGLRIRDRVVANVRPASARPASAPKGDSAGAALQRRRPRSAHPFSKGLIALTQPTQAQAQAQAQAQMQARARMQVQPALRIPEEFLELLKNRAIRKVSLGAQGLRPTDAEVLSNFLARDRVVTELVLPRNRIGCEGLAHLARALAGTPVELLDLSDNDLCHSGWPSQAHIFDAGALEELVDSLPETAVTDLDLSHNCLTGKDSTAASLQGVHAVARGLAAPAGCPLRRLSLAHNRLGDEGAELLGMALERRSHHLRVLDLSYCSLLSAPNGSRAARASGLIQIFKSLSSNHALRCLDLSGNAIGAADQLLSGGTGAICGRGVEMLANCFADSTMPALTELILADNSFTYGEECKLALSLLNNRSLDVLDVTPGPREQEQSAKRVLRPTESTSIGVHYVELLAQRDPGGGGKSSPLHWSCRQRSAASVAIMLWRHPKLLLEMDGYGDTPLDVARTVFDPACIELLERAYQQRISYRSRWVSSGEVVRADQQHMSEYAMDGETGQRVMLRFFPSEERTRWAYERDMLRAIAPGEDGGAGDRLIAGLVDSFFDESREKVGLPPFCLVLEAGESTLDEILALRRERQAYVVQSRFSEYGRDAHQLTAPSSMKAHAASLASVVFTPTEVRFLARHLAESLFHLHQTCRVAHAAIGARTIMRFGDGSWRTIDHFHSKPFGTVVTSAACAASCPPELATSILSGELPGLAISASYDVWGMGALVFELLTGRPLVASADAPFKTGAQQYDVHSRLAALDTTQVAARLVEIGDDAARDFVALLLGVAGSARVGVAALLGRGAGRTTPHKFLCMAAAERSNGWLSDQAVTPGNGNDDLTWVSVPRWSSVADADARGGTITTYEVVVNLPGQPVRSLNRRYAEFRWLLDALQDTCTAPEGGRRSKPFFGWEAGNLEPVHVGPLSPAAAERRCLGLQRFLQTAADINDECAQVVLRWLGPVVMGQESDAAAAEAAAEAAAAVQAAAEAVPKDRMRLGKYAGFPGVSQPFAPGAASDWESDLTVDASHCRQNKTTLPVIKEHQSPSRSRRSIQENVNLSISSITPEFSASVQKGNGEMILSESDAGRTAGAHRDGLVHPLAETATAVSELQDQLHTLLRSTKQAVDSSDAATVKPSAAIQQLASMLHAQNAIAEVLAASARAYAADAALPGLQRGNHSAEFAETQIALNELNRQMDFIGEQLLITQKAATNDASEPVPVTSVTWRRLDAALCRLLWLAGGFILGAHWVPVAVHLHRKERRQAAATRYANEKRKRAGKYAEPVEPPTEDDGERALPFITRVMLYWVYVGIICSMRMSNEGILAIADCDDNGSGTPISSSVEAAFDSRNLYFALDTECLWQKQSAAFIAAYVLHWYAAALLVTNWLVDGLWLIPLSKQLRRSQPVRFALVLESPRCQPGWSYLLTGGLALLLIAGAAVHSLVAWTS